MNDINKSPNNQQRPPTTSWEVIIIAILFFGTIVAITWMITH